MDDLDGVPEVDGLVNRDFVEAHVDHPDQVVTRHVILQRECVCERA